MGVSQPDACIRGQAKSAAAYCSQCPLPPAFGGRLPPSGGSEEALIQPDTDAFHAGFRHGVALEDLGVVAGHDHAALAVRKLLEPLIAVQHVGDVENDVEQLALLDAPVVMARVGCEHE